MLDTPTEGLPISNKVILFENLFDTPTNKFALPYFFIIT